MITVGITAFNCGKYLGKAIKSVLQQNSNCYEGILVLDGGADNETKRVFHKFNHPKFKKYVFKENQGPYGTRSKAIELSNTEWYYQLDGDDLLPPDSLKYIMESINNNPAAEFIYGDCEHFSNNNSIIKKPLSNPDELCIKPLFNTQSPIKISLFKSLGGFHSDFFINADWDFWLSVYERDIIGLYIDKLIYKRRRRSNNVGNQFLHLRPKILDKIIQRHPHYFNTERRRNIAKFFVNQQLAKNYKSIGDRKNAARFSRKALKYGDSIPVFDTIFQEEKMSALRFILRRMGRFI